MLSTNNEIKAVWRGLQKHTQRSRFWLSNLRSISEEPQPGPPKKLFCRRTVILEDKTQGFEHLRQPKASISWNRSHWNFKEKYTGLVFVDTFITFGPPLTVQAQKRNHVWNTTANLQKPTLHFLDRVVVFAARPHLQKFIDNSINLHNNQIAKMVLKIYDKTQIKYLINL